MWYDAWSQDVHDIRIGLSPVCPAEKGFWFARNRSYGTGRLNNLHSLLAGFCLDPTRFHLLSNCHTIILSFILSGYLFLQFLDTSTISWTGNLHFFTNKTVIYVWICLFCWRWFEITYMETEERGNIQYPMDIIHNSLLDYSNAVQCSIFTQC